MHCPFDAKGEKITIYSQMHEACMSMESKKMFLYEGKVTHYRVRGIFQDLRIYETSKRYRTAKNSHSKENAFKEN